LVTVRDLLKRLELRALAGEEGLDLPVRWVHISELADPTPWLSGGELLLTTGMQLVTAEAQRQFIHRLADHQLAGVGFGSGIVHDVVPAPLLEAAGERGLPVFEVPYELPFIAITEAAFTELVNEQYAVLRRALAAHERLERIVLAQRGLAALAGAIASLIGGTVAVLDARGGTLARHEFRRALSEGSWARLAEQVRSRRRAAREFIPSLQEVDQGLALPVPAEGTELVPDAWLVAVKDSGALSDFDRLTLRQAVTLVALELLRARVAGDTERRLAGEVLDAALSGELTGSELARRLAPFGLDRRAAALVLPGESARAAGSPPEQLLREHLRREGLPGLVAQAGELACALVPGLEDEELFALAEHVARRARAPVGAGRARPLDELRRAFHEARCAMEALLLAGAGAAGDRDGAPARAATYRDLGSFQLLLSLQDDDALRLFSDSILGPLLDGDGRHGGQLISSLEAFLEENGQWERAARRLCCHRHTLRYRIRRVEQLTGRRLSNARDRIELWLALRARELLAPARESAA
jgi:purine catabolism regulator